MITAWRLSALPLCTLALPACTAFSSVRSAEVVPGTTFDVGITATTPPGDAAAWFWSYDCASACDGAFAAVDVAFTRGHVPEGSGRPFEIGAGLSGFYPYAHGYVQLRRGPRPLGIGGRVALSPIGWHEAALLFRHDVPLGSRARLLVVPTLFSHWGNSPNGANPGRLVAFAQGLGVAYRSGGVSLTPSALLVVGRVHRRSYGAKITAHTLFGVFGFTARFGR
jgi:hypothetical protein